MLLAASLLAGGASRARGQTQGGASSLPDFSGFNLIDSFARLPPDRTSLGTLCEIRRASIEEVAGKTEAALQAVSESSDPAAAVRLHNAAAVVCLYRGDTGCAIAHFEEGLRIANRYRDENPRLDAMATLVTAGLAIAHLRRGELE